MDDFNENEMNAVNVRLKRAIDAIVLSHRTSGDVLTWRLLHAIEEEAFQEILAAGDLEPMYVRMMQSSPMFQFPNTDDPVDFRGSNALPMAYLMIYQAYRQSH
jgi:hypothetical protein